MQFLGDSKSIEEYLLELISQIDPSQQFKIIKTMILLTSFKRSDISALFSLLDADSRRRNNMICKQTSNTVPNICFSSRELSACLINVKKYLLVNPYNQCPNISTLNLIFLLGFCNHLRILFAFSKQDLQDQKSIQKQIIQFLLTLSQTLGNSNEAQQFALCIGIAIFDGNYNPNNQNFWLGQLQKLSKEQKLINKIPELGIKVLKSIIKQKKIFIISEKKSMQQLIQNVLANIKCFKINPKVLTQLYKKILKPNQIKKIVQEISGDQMSFKAKTIQTIQLIKQAVDNKQIFNQDRNLRNQAFQQQIFEKFPFKIAKQRISQIFKEIKFRKPQQYALQAAFFQFIQLYKTQNQFVTNDTKYNYLTYNIKNQSQNWEEDQMNISLIGAIINNIFSNHSIFYNFEMVCIGKFLQIVFRIFECVPGTQIRQYQKQLITELQKIIQKFIQYFYQTLSSSVEQILQNKVDPIPPKKLLSLTIDIQQLIKLLKQMSQKTRQPYILISEDIRNRKNYIVLTLFFIYWKCYQVFMKFWSIEQKNKFMIEIQDLVRNKQYRNFLQNHEKQRTVKIVKKINEYFGDLYFKNKSYFIAIKFYTSAKLNWKLIQTWNAWLQKILQKEDLNSDDIQEGIKKLASLGLVQEARKWCYKFMDRVDENQFFISLLQHLSELQKNQNIVIMEEIQKLKYDQISLVDDEVIRQVINQLEYQEWLKVENYYQV